MQKDICEYCGKNSLDKVKLNDCKNCGAQLPDDPTKIELDIIQNKLDIINKELIAKHDLLCSKKELQKINKVPWPVFKFPKFWKNRCPNCKSIVKETTEGRLKHKGYRRFIIYKCPNCKYEKID